MIDEFLYRRFIPEENRGGTFHVVLLENGRLVGPLSPERAAAKGYTLPVILAELNQGAIAELGDEREKTSRLEAELADVKGKLAKAEKERDTIAQAHGALLAAVQPAKAKG